MIFICCYRILPIVVYAIVWFQSKLHFENLCTDISRRVSGLQIATIVHRVKCCVFRRPQQTHQSHHLHESELQIRDSISDNAAVLMTLE
jgi:hypothetical protein